MLVSFLSLFQYLAFLYTYVVAPVAELREYPQEEAKVASQVRFSDRVEVIAKEGDWVKIEVPKDQYKGWVKKSAICSTQTPFLEDSSKSAIKVNRLAAHLYSGPEVVYGPILTLPFESRLELVESSPQDDRWLKVRLPHGKIAYIQRGDVVFGSSFLSREEMVAFSKRFLGLPYTWGGASSFGYDCSGFVQMLYRQMGVTIPRNSRRQCCWEGFVEVDFNHLKPGDLIFFGTGEKVVRHVGLFLGDDQFIHATIAEDMPYIHISRLSDPYWNGQGSLPYRTARTLKSHHLTRQ